MTTRAEVETVARLAGLSDSEQARAVYRWTRDVYPRRRTLNERVAEMFEIPFADVVRLHPEARVDGPTTGRVTLTQEDA